jgi:hypothetical protein
MENGGKREGAGRKPKADEIKIIEQMDAIAVPELAWKKLWLLCENGDSQALKLWLSYRFGMPRQSVDLTTQGDKITEFKLINFNNTNRSRTIL